MELYKKIKARREELGMSQEELATKLGYKSRSTINKIEMGKNDLTQSKILAFAKALHTTPAYLMDWEESAKTNSYDLPDVPSPAEVDPDSFAFQMYKKLDSDDKAEIRGEMKHMLKSDKYADTSKIVDTGRTAAYGGESATIGITKDTAKKIHEIKRRLEDN